MNTAKRNKIIIGSSIIGLILIIGIVSSMIRGAAPSVNPPKEANKIVKHAEMDKELKSEKEVSAGDVYLKPDVAVANITVKENITKEQAKVLAEKYAEELKDQYEELSVIVDVKQGDKDLIKDMIPATEDQLAAEAKVFMGVEYVKVDFKEFLGKDITKVLINEKQVDKKTYKVEDGQLTIINVNKDSKIKVVLGTKTYNVIYLKK